MFQNTLLINTWKAIGIGNLTTVCKKCLVVVFVYAIYCAVYQSNGTKFCFDGNKHSVYSIVEITRQNNGFETKVGYSVRLVWSKGVAIGCGARNDKSHPSLGFRLCDIRKVDTHIV